MVKVHSIYLQHLNKAEFSSLMNLVIELVDEGTATALGIPEATLEEMRKDLELLRSINLESKASEETATLDELESQRDALVTYILSTCRNGRSLVIATKKAAAESLYRQLGVYSGITSKPNRQETELIIGMVADLRKEENAEAIATLGLTEEIDELERVNNEYATLDLSRMKAKANTKTETSAAIRERMMTQYDIVTNFGFAQSLINPSEATATFINHLNQAIDDTQTAYNQRMGKTAGDKPNDTVPIDPGTEPEPTDPGEGNEGGSPEEI